MNPWCAPTRPPRRSFVASDARCREQVCTVPTRPESTYRSGNAVQTTGATSVRDSGFANFRGISCLFSVLSVLAG